MGEKRFRLPRKILIKGMEYKIRRKKGLKYEGKPVYGLHDPRTRTIWIDSELKSQSLLRITLIHEMFHGYIDVCVITEGLDRQLEEVIVDLLASAINKHFKISWK